MVEKAHEEEAQMDATPIRSGAVAEWSGPGSSGEGLAQLVFSGWPRQGAACLRSVATSHDHQVFGARELSEAWEIVDGSHDARVWALLW